MRCNLCGSSSAYVFPCPIPGDPEARACGTCLEEHCLACDEHRAEWIDAMEADAARSVATSGVRALDELLGGALAVPRGDLSPEAWVLAAAMAGGAR